LAALYLTIAFAIFFALTFLAWRRYLWAAQQEPLEEADTCPYSLTDVFGDRHLINAPHQKGIRWLTDVFSRSARKFPNHTALQIPHTGESLTFAELDARAENIAAALAPFLTGPDQVVAVAMSQDNWQIVAAHLGILKAGGTLMFLDTTSPDALITHMLNDAQPVVVLTRGQDKFRDLPVLDVLTLPEKMPRRQPPTWLDDPTQRLATIFYTSGTTGMPRGVECPHAGYVNLALSYADYFDLIPGMDATSLTSSLGYDGSISEMYSAWVSGCAVVLLTKEQVRSGPDLVPVLREAEVTMLFCPPVLLTTLTPTPEVDLPYPLCRYIVPAGEAFPSALVEPWTRGRRQIINTYGPTEASTDTSRQSLRPGEPITIGSPFPNVTYVILEIDQLRPLPHGEVGELCIGGVHVARGYRNLPEQTVQKFIAHPQFGRLYRTGDKCKIDIKTQRVYFLGRIDAQLKVRGHRVEAQAVEDILQTQFSEIEAAVLDYQNEALVAFVAAPSVCEGEISVVAPAPIEWADRVTATLTKQLPAPSVPTRIFLVEKFVMKPVSGKIDRKCLPNLSHLMRNAERGIVDTRRDTTADAWNTGAKVKPPDADAGMDHAREEVLAICRAVFERPLRLDDGFAEAGGHSILIARMAQQLQAAGWAVSVRALLSDCNTARKVANCPRVQEQASKPPTPRVKSDDNIAERDEAAAEVLSIRYFTTLQFLFAALLYAPGLIAFVSVFGVADAATFFMTASLWEFIVGGFLLYLVLLIVPFANLLWVMTIKFFMGGHVYQNNVTPGVYPKWSKMHLRIWCIGRMENLVLVPLAAMYRSAPLRSFVLRQLGATVDENLQCAHDASLTGPLDLIFIENNVAIQTGAYIQTTSWSGQQLHVGPVHLQRGCKIGMRAAVANNVTVGHGTWITPFTPILSDVGSQEIWEGAPARLSGHCTELKRTAKTCRYGSPIWLLETVNILMQIFIFFWISAVPFAVILWFASGFIFAGETMSSDADFRVTSLFELVWPLTLDAFIATWVTVVVTSLLGCLFIRWTAASPGLYPSRGLKGALLMYRMNRMNAIQRQWNWTITGQYLRALAGVRFARLGASECDVMFNLVPELTTADSQVFWSNGSFTNMLDYGAEHFKLRQLDMPRNFFSGNNCVAEYGQFPSNFLLGVSTPGNEIQFRRQMRSRLGEPLTVAGNPPVKFASASFEAENESHQLPSFPLFLTRVFLNDLFSIGILPIAEGLVFTMLYLSFVRSGAHSIISALAALILTEVTLVSLCVVIKKLLIGSKWGADHATPFWSWKHFAYFFAQDCFFAWCRTPLAFCAGTILANPILRWMGCRIGRRTIVATPMQCFDWNAVSFGNDCYVDGLFQFHTLENMMLKVKRTHIQDGCAVNIGATVMGGAVIEPETTLLPLSLVLKEMRMLPATYEGSPAEPVEGSILLPASLSADVALSVNKSLSAEGYDATISTSTPQAIDNTDWLKAAAIFLVSIDHTGYFFIDDDQWWSVFGRLAAPVFFFLLGYARTRAVPRHWILLGVILTLLESWNHDWTWVAPNILLSFALIRIARPSAQTLMERHGWVAFALLAAALIAVLPMASKTVDYGAEGWLWALFGLCQRMYVDSRAATGMNGTAQSSAPPGHTITENAGLMSLPCLVAATVYVWQEQNEFSFSQLQLSAFILGVGILSLSLFLFRRGPSRIQPPESIAGGLRFIGRHTLEIYAIQLACFELIVKLVPDLAP
jgi:non-ribosomal peptide synthetase-like protein